MTTIAAEYIGRGIGASEASRMLHIPRCSLYRRSVRLESSRGRRPSSLTLRMDGKTAVVLSNTDVVTEIKRLLSREFVCYGYHKVTKHLQHAGFSINKKKVFRLMSEHSLLNHTYNTRSPVKRVVESKVIVSSPNEVWEMDIKYVWIAGDARNVFFLAIIDCFTREVVEHHLGYHCNGGDVREALMSAFHRRGIGEIGAVRIRNDNGTQLICRKVEEMLAFMNIAHERIHPATPREDAHIESFNSILEKEVMRRFEFDSFRDAEQAIYRFIDFYNNERLHSGVGYYTPRQAYLKWKEISMEEVFNE